LAWHIRGQIFAVRLRRQAPIRFGLSQFDGTGRVRYGASGIDPARKSTIVGIADGKLSLMLGT
jgi:hypothetical protein